MSAARQTVRPMGPGLAKCEPRYELMESACKDGEITVDVVDMVLDRHYRLRAGESFAVVAEFVGDGPWTSANDAPGAAGVLAWAARSTEVRELVGFYQERMQRDAWEE